MLKLHKSRKCYVYMNKFDLFGEPIPTFNYKGHSQLGTPFGLIATTLFAIFLSLYSVSKFIHLVTFKNPLITNASETE